MRLLIYSSLSVTGNLFIFMSVIVSSVISVFSVFVVVTLFIRFRTRLETQYFKYLEGKRKLSNSKKEIEGKMSPSKKLAIEQNRIRKIRFLQIQNPKTPN